MGCDPRLLQVKHYTDDEKESDDYRQLNSHNIDPRRAEWVENLRSGQQIDVRNSFGNWCAATVVDIVDNDLLHVHYCSTSTEWDERLNLYTRRIAPKGTEADTDSPFLNTGQKVDVRLPDSPARREAYVVQDTPTRVQVRFPGMDYMNDVWIHKLPQNIYAHKRDTSGLRSQRQISIQSNQNRSRVIKAQNPQFGRYCMALRQNNLHIVEVEGDGNCLFRSVSHQIYGDDRFHPIVREKCMDYMESEKEYFEPYVVGTMEDFLRYIQNKRRDAVWGDDPEIQALCELYDRPAEVYAYDATHGARKLRTFHESNGISRNRPAIRLSYYGGGHYDSLTGLGHEDNLVREEPGTIEQRRISLSRNTNSARISTNRLSTQSLADDQIALALRISREEFDQLDNNIDESLKLSLQQFDEDQLRRIETQDIEQATQDSELVAMQAEMVQRVQQQSEQDHINQAIRASLSDVGQVQVNTDDTDITAALQASLQDSNAFYEAQMQQAMSLSVGSVGIGHDFLTGSDEMDFQQAIQESLRRQ